LFEFMAMYRRLFSGKDMENMTASWKAPDELMRRISQQLLAWEASGVI
jgi:hypothetical protein